MVRYPTSVALLDRRDGSVRWQHELERFTRPGMVVHDGEVMIRAGTDQLTAISLDTGDAIWEHQHDLPTVSPTVGADDRTYTFDADGQLLAINGSGQTMVAGELEDHIPTGTPIISRDRIIVPTNHGVVVFDTQP